MRRLILMRHAEAAAESGAADHARALTTRGRSDALRAGDAMAEARRLTCTHVLLQGEAVPLSAPEH